MTLSRPQQLTHKGRRTLKIELESLKPREELDVTSWTSNGKNCSYVYLVGRQINIKLSIRKVEGKYFARLRPVDWKIKTTHERVPFKLIVMPCCGTVLCHVNPRLPNYCPECGYFIFAKVRESIRLVDDHALLTLRTKIV